jgi:hypothetical protein
MTWFIFIVASLACFRLSRLFSDDLIFDQLRLWIVRSVPQKSKKKTKQGINCAFCISFYVAAGIASVLWWQGYFNIWVFWLWAAGIWGASVIFNQLFVFLSK